MPCTVQEIRLAAAACLAEANAFICRNGARIKTEHMQFHIVQVQRFKAIAQQQAQHLLAIALASVRLTADKQAYLAAAPLPIYLFYAAVSNKPVLLLQHNGKLVIVRIFGKPALLSLQAYHIGRGAHAVRHGRIIHPLIIPLRILRTHGRKVYARALQLFHIFHFIFPFQHGRAHLPCSATHAALHLHDKILHIGHNGLYRQAAPVQQLVHGKFRNIHRIEIQRTHLSVHHAVAGRHIPGGYRVQRRCHTDDGSGLADQAAHSVLPLVHIAVYIRQRPVIADRTHQNKGHIFLHTGIHDAVLHGACLHKRAHRTAAPHFIDGVQMIVMAVRHRALGVYILPKGSAAVAHLQVMGGKGISRQKPVYIAFLHQRRKGPARICVKGAGRAQHPQNIAVLFFKFQQPVNGIIILGISRLAASALAEGKFFFRVPRRRNALVCT